MASPTSVTTDEFRLLTWSRPELSRMTIELQSLQRHCPLDNGRLQQPIVFDAKYIASPSNIGDLEALPLEIVHLIFDILDLKNLICFRAISWRSRALVDGFPPYNAIVQHSPEALRALLSTHMAIHFTAQNILDALCTQACLNCGQFGPFLDMFTGYRCCVTCVIYSDNLLSITASSAKRRFGLNSKTMRTLPTLLSIPGQYTESERTYRRRILLVRAISAAAAGSMQKENLHSSLSGTRLLGRRPVPQPSQLPQPHVSRPSLSHSDRHGQNPYRFMAMIRIPFLDRMTGKLDWGVSCQACRLGPRDERRGYCNWNTVYTAAGYMKHFQKCEVSQIGRKEMTRYIVPINTGIYEVDDLCFPPILVEKLPPIPEGDWNWGRISQTAQNPKPLFSETIKKTLPSISPLWHSKSYDYLSFQFGERLRSNVYMTSSPQFEKPIVAKFARFHWEIGYYIAETRAYSWINGRDIGPAFLGYLTENGRVIGFHTEYIEGHHATISAV